ncbi:putative inactive 1-aminocyclopropane-1-carboxylate synthase-like protein 2 [Oratosquilla oratoria]|uniref:putative inactive 1-aminocyclopropane-1-carboxylate synthase-like protein 2 n=1 Tax=Oratosquilla oratoria TaxID=337810 RepID=UPI003F76E86A
MSEKDTDLLSQRGSESFPESAILSSYNKYLSNPFHAKDNPKGIINLGTAITRTMEDEIKVRMMQGDALRYGVEYQHYYNYSGIEDLRKATADILTRQLAPDNPVSPDDLIVMNGAYSCMESLSYALMDPGDAVIMPTPVYPGVFKTFHGRSRLDIHPVALRAKPDSEGRTFQLRVEEVEAKVNEAKATGRRVRAFILVNPQNPLGEVYPPDLLLDLLNLCAKHKMHFICNELYAMSVYDADVAFHSLLAFKELPDPDRTHVIWGMSKDFGLAGFRVGVVHTRSAPVKKCLVELVNSMCTPHLIQKACAVLLQDKAWCDMFIPTHKRRLGILHRKCVAKLENAGVAVRRGEGGFFVWVDFSPFLKDHTAEAETELFLELMEGGTFTRCGSDMSCQDPGWFRLIFSLSEIELEEGLNRILKVLQNRASKQILT